MKNLAILFFCIASNIAIAQTNWTTYTNNEFAIDHPKTWTQSPDTYDANLILNSALEENDTFSENVNIIINDLNGQNITMKEMVEASEKDLLAYLQNANILSSDGNPTKHEIVISGSTSGFELKFKQVYMLKSDKMIVITYTALEETYDAYFPTAEKIMSSFRLN